MDSIRGRKDRKRTITLTSTPSSILSFSMGTAESQAAARAATLIPAPTAVIIRLMKTAGVIED